MDTYNIEIEEILQRVIKIEAESKEEALIIAKEKYRNEEIILDYNDFKNVSFKHVQYPCGSGTKHKKQPQGVNSLGYFVV